MNKFLLRLGNSLFKVSPALYRMLYSHYKEYSDRNELRIIRDVVKNGFVVLDIGANIGFYSGVLSKLVGNSGKIYSFEPETKNFSLLKSYVQSLDNVDPINAAVGSSSGELVLFLSEELNVDHHTYDDGTGRERVVTRVVSLDDYFNADVSVDFIKMDIQGYEYQALLGGKEFLSKNTSLRILFEFWPFGIKKAGDDPYALLVLLEESGFKLDYLGDDGCRDIDYYSTDYDYYFNIYAYKG